ncbi:fungal-specific transcription factor domain-containing protein [Plectosphaerella plurivora]|uniref:Fungal-specific transcription factor domain-containing protein n=1 Tax=Plectosphaerella plurivora TaxID=936078 RepID=A0A9P8VKI9_9PEZI|nr:fungal-specific transcription factor domain-containing protein [Plectosphaerella plurivora]
MTNSAGWLPFDAQQPKKRRAECVCTWCHSKKIKCDLQARLRNGHNDCSNCTAAEKACQRRPSKRTKRRVATAPPEEMVIDSVQASKPSGSDAQIPTPDTTAHASHHRNSPSQHSHISDARSSEALANGQSQTGDIDTGFLQVYGPENRHDAEEQATRAFQQHKSDAASSRRQDLEESFMDTYWEYCYTWCPVLDRDRLTEDLARSPLLENALAAACSHIQPPLLPHEGPAEYYKRARTLFYDDAELDGLTSLKAVSLFYWWAPRPPTVVHRHSSWWWTSVLIRHAQQMNIHREPDLARSDLTPADMSIRRRIWWTAFARERLTALCQSKPAIIDPDDCTIQEPTLDDFPNDPQSRRKGEIFIYWVRLSAIIGRIAKTLSKVRLRGDISSELDLHRLELMNWVTSLPTHLQLPITAARTQNFDRDVHQLHLPYLTTIIVLYLKRSAASSHTVPEALPPAILAASCIARVFRDILARGNTRFLMAISCWYTGTAFIPLLQARSVPHLAQDAEEGLDVLIRTAEQLQTMWASANVIRQGFDRLRAAADASRNGAAGSTDHIAAAAAGVTDPAGEEEELGCIDWMALFPFVTAETTGIAGSLLKSKAEGNVTRGFPSPARFFFNDDLMYDGQFDITGMDFELEFLLPP